MSIIYATGSIDQLIRKFSYPLLCSSLMILLSPHVHISLSQACLNSYLITAAEQSRRIFCSKWEYGKQKYPLLQS